MEIIMERIEMTKDAEHWWLQYGDASYQIIETISGQYASVFDTTVIAKHDTFYDALDHIDHCATLAESFARETALTMLADSFAGM